MASEHVPPLWFDKKNQGASTAKRPETDVAGSDALGEVVHTEVSPTPPPVEAAETSLEGGEIPASEVINRSPEQLSTIDQPDVRVEETAEQTAEHDDGPLLTAEEAEWLIYGRDGRSDADAVRKGALL